MVVYPSFLAADDARTEKTIIGKNEYRVTAHDESKLFELGHYLSRFNFHPSMIFSRLDQWSMYRLDMKRFIKKLSFNPGKKKRKRLGRALLELTGHFIYATASYWIRQEVMKEDWEYQFTWEDQKKRFLFIDGMRFDSNTFQFNWTHSLAGAIYYNYARVNNMSPWQSFLFSSGASYFWEFVVEFREVVSVNDLISTPIGGLPVGESMFQLGRFFRSNKQKRTFLNRIARFLSNPIMALDDWIDKKRSIHRHAYDEDFWYDMRLSAGPRFDVFSNDDTHTFMDVGFESQMVHLPEYGTLGTSHYNVGNTLFSEFNLQGAVTNKGLYEFKIFAKSVLFGAFWQDIRAVNPTKKEKERDVYGRGLLDDMDDTNRQGYSLFIGAATAFDTYKKNYHLLMEPNEEEPANIPDKFDKYTVINLFGPTVDLAIFRKDLKIRLTADAYGDFALVHAHAYKDYLDFYQHGQTKSTLENHGYYYALGITLSSFMQINFANLELIGRVKYHYFDSIEGLDRFQKDMADEDDFDLIDQRLNYSFSLGYRIPRTSLQLVLGLEQRERWGNIEGFKRHSSERRSYVQLKYIF